jgi:flagellar biogenesis protein FliO
VMGAMVNSAMARTPRLDGDGLAARILGWLRRLTGVRAAAVGAPLRAEARLNLGPKKSLVLVNCCGRRVLLGLSGDAMVPLGEWPQAKTKTASDVRREAAR